MFQALIDQARALIQRLHASVRQGRDDVPEAEKLRLSELEAWDAASHGIVELVFGPAALETARWRSLTERRAGLAGEAMRKDIKRGEFFGLIDYFHLAIGMLLEFEARYQLALAATPAPASSTALAARPGLAVPEPAAQPAPREPEAAPESSYEPEYVVEQPPPAARPSNGRWELTIAVGADTYQWLAEVAKIREPASADDRAAARLAATILDRVAANTRFERRGG